MSLSIGFGQSDITPPEGTRMAGFFGDRHVEKIHDPLYARAVAIDDGRHPLILVTCDLLSLRHATVSEAKQQVAQATGVPGGQVMIAATHTHTGPATSRIFTRDPDPAYVGSLASAIAGAAIAAWKGRAPGSLGQAWGFEGKLSFNRRFLMRSTRQVLMHPPKGSTDILWQEGKVDPEVGLLAARHSDGSPHGCLLNFACHVNVVGGADVSADYPGYFAQAMQRHHGPDYYALFANGCCGNLCQIDVYDPQRKDAGHEWARHMGETLARDAMALEAACEYRDDLVLDSRYVELQLPMRRIPPDLEQWARDYLSGQIPGDLRESIYAGMTLEMRERIRTRPMVTAPIQAFRIGEVGWVMLPGEIFVEYGLQIKLDSPALRTFVVELANGVVGYVPTPEAFAGGGYEQRTATSSRLTPAAGQIMVETALTLLDSMFL